MKKIYTLFLSIFAVIIMCSCSKKITVKNLSVIHEPEFGGIYITKTIEDFNKLGFAYGDSVDIEFSNGYKLLDQPYYNGYYVDAGNSLLVGYSGYDYIKAAINYGEDLWDVAGLEEDSTATIKLRKKKKYLDIQEASDIHYFDEREKYDTDEEFANFRAMNVGNLKNNIIFRSASPCDNKHKRAHYTDTLMEENGIQFILNLADTQAKIEAYMAEPDFNSPYFRSLYLNHKFFLSFSGYDDKVMPIALNMNYLSDEFREKVSNGIASMVNSDGPYLVHCLEGKDRTGFVCIVIEALMEASYQEIVDDYMLTYDNYYGIDINDKRYDIIKKRNVDSMLSFIAEGNDIKNSDLSSYAKKYLKAGGMSDETLELLIQKLHK